MHRSGPDNLNNSTQLLGEILGAMNRTASKATLALKAGLCLRRDLMVLELSKFSLLSGHFYGKISHSYLFKNRCYFFSAIVHRGAAHGHRARGVCSPSGQSIR